MSLPRYVCIHGHFYQPPRENPWLEAVEVQDSAQPYHDWNERITMECYGPNTAARITTWDGRILDIRNNYEKISFNFGPTLLQWMETNRPEIYEDITEADRASVRKRNGHGNAIAQAYNHTILPLATEREKIIQVIWGLEDFRERFARDPEGMWLPECAVDIDTLEVLASCGIRFTILSPGQARAHRTPAGPETEWQDCNGGQIDPTRPYVCNLPSGKSITLFFYDGPISQAVAFEGLLNDGNFFAHRLMQGFSNNREWPQIVSIATDGESYGHHHHRGEMALAYALHVIEREGWAELTNYAEYLALHPPTEEARIWNKSSWSCAHGVERWQSDCGCHSGKHPGWHQRWRGPLRDAFRLLAGAAEELFDTEAPKHFEEPHQALLEYIRILLDRRPETVREFLAEHCRSNGEPLDMTVPLRLLEIMRNAQLMFTSCAWFFDEVSGIEGVQTLKYAGRLIQLMLPYAPELEGRFLEVLTKAESNLPDVGNGAEAYRRFVKPGIIDLYRVVAHYAICSIDCEERDFHRLFCYDLNERDSVTSANGTARLKLCRIRALSLIDGAQVDTTAVVLHFGGSDFRCSIGGPLPFDKYVQVRDEVLAAFRHRSITRLIRVVDEHFGQEYYGLQHVFSEGKRELLQRITMESFRRFDDSITLIYEENRKFMDYLLDEGAPLPQGFLSAADFVLKTHLVTELDKFLKSADATRLMEIAQDMRRYRIHVGDMMVTRKISSVLEEIFHELARTPSLAASNVALLMLDVLETLGLSLDLWEAQNVVFALIHGRPLPAHLARKVPAPADGEQGISPTLNLLAERLKLSTEPVARTLGLPSPVRGGSSEQLAKR